MRKASGAERGSSVAVRRANTSALVGAVGLFAARGLGTSWPAAGLAGWDAAAVLYLLWVWLTVGRKDAGQTKRAVQGEDDRIAGEVVLLAAGTASLVAVAFTLNDAGDAHGGNRVGLIAFALASVLLAWGCIQTVYMLRYARIYYSSSTPPIGFNEADPPNYLDFLYLAFTIGMTFQVSDTDLSAKRVRRVAIRHALLSYVFSAFIVAIVVNVVAGLLGK